MAGLWIVVIAAAAGAPDPRQLLFAAGPVDTVLPTTPTSPEGTAVCYEHNELMQAIEETETVASLAPLTQLKVSDLFRQAPEQIDAVKRVGIVLPADWECQSATSEGVHPCPDGVPSQCRYYNFDLDAYHKADWTTQWNSSLVPNWADGLSEADLSLLLDTSCAQYYCATVQPDHFCCGFLPADYSPIATELWSDLSASSLGPALCGTPDLGGLTDYFAGEQWGYADWQSDPNVATHYVSFDVNRLEAGHAFGLQLYSPGLDVLIVSPDGSLEFNPLGSKLNIPVDESMQYSFEAVLGGNPNSRRMSETMRRPSDRKEAQEVRFEGSCHPASGCRSVAFRARPPTASNVAQRRHGHGRHLSSSTHMSTGITASRISASAREVPPENMRLVGRWARQSGEWTGDWPGIGFELSLTAGPTSMLVLNAWSIAASAYDQGLRCAYDVDPSTWGSQQNIVLNLKSAQTKYSIEPPTTLGRHLLKCIKFTEKDDDGRGILFKGVTVSSDVAVHAPPPPRLRKMVFYGDSDTACGSCCDGPKYGGDDVTSGWAYQLASRFQADAHFLSIGGQYVGRCGAAGDDGMCTLIHRTLPWNQNSRYNFGEFKADVVTIFLGANDNWPGSSHGTNSAAGKQFQIYLLALINKVWGHHAGEGGASPIIVGVCGGSGSPKHDKSQYCQNVKAAINSFNSMTHKPRAGPNQARYVEISKTWWTQSMASDSEFQGCYDHWSDYGGRGVVDSVLSTYEEVTGWAETGAALLPEAVAKPSGNSCSGATMKPLTVGQCKLAADAIGETFHLQEKSANWPAGCYKCSGSASCTAGVWWNKHKRGKAQSTAGPVCVMPRDVDKAPPPPPPSPEEPTQLLRLYRLLNSGWKGTDSCGSSGLSAISSAGDCRGVAAKELQLAFADSEHTGDWPKGCYLWLQDNEVYWNSHRTGSRNEGGVPICVGAEVVPSLNGKSSCAAEGGLHAVATMQDCKKAAKALKKDFDGSESAKNWPPGCYFCESCGAAYWNTHTGSANSDATPICSSALP